MSIPPKDLEEEKKKKLSAFRRKQKKEEELQKQDQEQDQASKPGSEDALKIPSGNFLQLEPLVDKGNDPKVKPGNFLEMFEKFRNNLTFEQQKTCRPGKGNSIEFDDPNLLAKFLSTNDIKSGKISCKDQEGAKELMKSMKKFAPNLVGAPIAFNFVFENKQEARLDNKGLHVFEQGIKNKMQEEAKEKKLPSAFDPSAKPRPPGAGEG